jgi:hypothetical protein
MRLNAAVPALVAMVLIQLAPQAAWSWGGNCRYNYVPPAEARRIWRAEHFGYARPYGYYAPQRPYYYHGGLLSGVTRAIF